MIGNLKLVYKTKCLPNKNPVEFTGFLFKILKFGFPNAPPNSSRLRQFENLAPPNSSRLRQFENLAPPNSSRLRQFENLAPPNSSRLPRLQQFPKSHW
jgi:hypothetical protein